jgi:hypothetical protein
MIKLLFRTKAKISSAHSIVVEYQDLVDGKNLKPVIEEAYGPKGNLSSTQVWEYSLLIISLTMLSKGKIRFPSSISLPICPRKL